MDDCLNWFIWSDQHNAWRGPDRCGYTTDISQACTYAYFDAEKCTKESGEKMIHCGSRRVRIALAEVAEAAQKRANASEIVATTPRMLCPETLAAVCEWLYQGAPIGGDVRLEEDGLLCAQLISINLRNGALDGVKVLDEAAIRRQALEEAASTAADRHKEWRGQGPDCTVKDDASACADIADAIRALIDQPVPDTVHVPRELAERIEGFLKRETGHPDCLRGYMLGCELADYTEGNKA